MHQPPKPSLPGTAKSGASRQRGENQQLMIIASTNTIKRVDHARYWTTRFDVCVVCFGPCLSLYYAHMPHMHVCVGVVTSKTFIWYVSILPWEKNMLQQLKTAAVIVTCRWPFPTKHAPSGYVLSTTSITRARFSTGCLLHAMNRNCSSHTNLITWKLEVRYF